MGSETARTVIVIGGGASGTLAAIHLARSDAACRVLLVEGRGRLGAGVAYGTHDDVHVLNVAAGAMSAFPDDPDHFVRWAGCERTDFLPRPRYAGYLGDVLAAHHDVVEPVVGRAVGAVPGRCGIVVELDDGRALGADAAVLALGNLPPSTPCGVPPDLASSPRYVPDPWRAGALDDVRVDEPVLLVGTGLTAVDVALGLVERGHQGQVHAVSRRGLLPRAHRHGCRQPQPFPVPDGVLTVSRLVRAFRSELAASGDWREVVDSLRPRTQEVWERLGPVEQRRFLVHLARRWEVHRHRMAPQVAARVHLLVATGRLSVSAGGVHREQVERAARVVNCTGPSYDVSRRRERLVADLLRRGLVRPGPHRLGLDVSPDGAVLDRLGRPSPALFTLGPLCRGRRWETTAVPEIRDQAAHLASRLSLLPSRLELV